MSLKVLIPLLVLLFVADIFVDKSHAHFSLEKISGFWTLFALFSTLLLAVITSVLSKVLRRDFDDK